MDASNMMLVIDLWNSDNGPNCWSYRFYNVLPASIKLLATKVFELKVKDILIKKAYYDTNEFLQETNFSIESVTHESGWLFIFKYFSFLVLLY